MTILLDHCVQRRYLRLLREWGYDVQLLGDHIPVDSSDPDVLKLAAKLDAVLLTDDLDFSDIRAYPPQDYGGLIVMRYTAQDEAALDQTLKSALTDLYREGLRGVLVIVAANRYRIRRG